MSWTSLHAAVHQTLRQRQLLEPGQSILLGFSGGQDSMCLLHLLRDLQPKWHWQLAIAHCDHRWPPESGANAQQVESWAQDWQVEHYRLTAPRVLQGEAAGRDWRYEVMGNLAVEQGFSAVVTAHTASDRAETLLYNLMRGSGMDGLQALTWQRPLTPQVQLVRPLLNLTRQQTGDFCRQLALPVWADSMNQDRAYHRNQIRLDLLPYLQDTFNPQVELALAKTAEILQAETAYLDAAAHQILAQATQPDGQRVPSGLPALSQTVLRTAPLALQRRAIRHWLKTYLPHHPSFAQIEKVVRLIQGPNGDRTDPFAQGWFAEVQRPWIYLRSPS